VFSIDISLSVCYIHTEIKKDLHTDESPKGKRKTMKKILTVLLVMVVAMGFVFADNEAAGNTHSLNLTASVDSVMEAHWAEAGTTVPTTQSDWDSFDSNDGEEVAVSFSVASAQSIGTFGYATNNITLAKFKIEGTVFSAVSDDPSATLPTTTVGYTIYSNGSEIVKSGETATTFIEEDQTTGGLRFGGKRISVLLDSTEAASAGAGTYNATVTVTTEAI
jgi:hypothetical protein